MNSPTRKPAFLDAVLAAVLFCAAAGYETLFFKDYCYGFGNYDLYLSDGGGIFYAAQVVLDGGKIGRDYETFWGPWPYHYHAVFLRLFGNKMTSLKIATIAADAMFAVIVYLLFRQVSRRRPAFLFALFMCLFNQHHGYWNNGYASFYTLGLGWGAFLLFLLYLRTRRAWSLFMAGLVAGIAYGFKFSFSLYVIMGLATVLYMRWLLEGVEMRGVSRNGEGHRGKLDAVVEAIDGRRDLELLVLGAGLIWLGALADVLRLGQPGFGLGQGLAVVAGTALTALGLAVRSGRLTLHIPSDFASRLGALARGLSLRRVGDSWSWNDAARLIFAAGLTATSLIFMWAGMRPMFAVPIALVGIMLLLLASRGRQPGLAGLAGEMLTFAAGVLAGVGPMFCYYAVNANAGVALELVNPVGRALGGREITTQFGDVAASMRDLMSLFVDPLHVILVLIAAAGVAMIEYRIMLRGRARGDDKAPASARGREFVVLRMAALCVMGLAVLNAVSRILDLPRLYPSLDSLQAFAWAFAWIFPAWIAWRWANDRSWVRGNEAPLLAGIFSVFLVLCNFPGVNRCNSMWGGFVGMVMIALWKLETAEREGKPAISSLLPAALFVLLAVMFAEFDIRGICAQTSLVARGESVLLDEECVNVYVEKDFADDMRALKQHIRENVAPHEQILAACAFPFVYSLADRHNDLPQKAFFTGSNSDRNQGRAVEYLDRNRVKSVIGFAPLSSKRFGYAADLEADYPRLHEYVAANYERAGRFGRFEVYVRR